MHASFVKTLSQTNLTSIPTLPLNIVSLICLNAIIMNPCQSQPLLRLHEGIHCNLQTFYIPQLDGLPSDSCSYFDSSNLSSSPSVSDIPSNEISWFSLPELPSQVEGLAIPVRVSHRPSPTPSSHNPRRQRTNVPKNNITVKRDKRFLEALSLPTFSVYNMKSVLVQTFQPC